MSTAADGVQCPATNHRAGPHSEEASGERPPAQARPKPPVAPRARVGWRSLLSRLGLAAAFVTGLGLATLPASVQAVPITLVDDGGPDDLTGQKDLTQLTTNEAGLPTSIAIGWNWDDTAWSGNNTGDACSLFDTNSNGFANYALCVTVGSSPATYQSTRLYSCGDTDIM